MLKPSAFAGHANFLKNLNPPKKKSKEEEATKKRIERMQQKSENTQKKRTDMEEGSAGQRELSEFNELLSCRICQGYMIDPTTVDFCYHTCKFAALFLHYFCILFNSIFLFSLSLSLFCRLSQLHFEAFATRRLLPTVQGEWRQTDQRG